MMAVSSDHKNKTYIMKKPLKKWTQNISVKLQSQVIVFVCDLLKTPSALRILITHAITAAIIFFTKYDTMAQK